MRLLQAGAVMGVTMLATFALAQQAAVPYRDPSLSIDDRVKDLLSRMTLGPNSAETATVNLTVEPR